jgi:hypothetical protein
MVSLTKDQFFFEAGSEEFFMFAKKAENNCIGGKRKIPVAAPRRR